MKNKNSYEVLEAEVAKLKEENRHLKDERDELKYMLNDMHSVVDAANDDFFNEMSRLCGCIEIEGTRITAAYQDLVGILLANGYTVEVTPLHNNTRLQVVIKESASLLIPALNSSLVIDLLPSMTLIVEPSHDTTIPT